MFKRKVFKSKKEGVQMFESSDVCLVPLLAPDKWQGITASRAVHFFKNRHCIRCIPY